MGNSPSSPSNANNNGAASASSGGCPVDHSKIGKQQSEEANSAAGAAAAGKCPVKHDASGSSSSASSQGSPTGGCPVDHSKMGKQQYNVYAQPIDPTNQMPLNPNQLPAPGQTKKLSTERVQSHIPKGGSEADTWQYPSPQMFYNALMRKGKGSDVDEEEVETIVAVHNNMNERAWNLVLEWEMGLHGDAVKQGQGIRLSRFLGRPDDISPMAWFKSTFMGYPKPFDRHDWVIDRDGKEVRYIIDFYFDEESSKFDEKPGLHDVRSIKSITMDARPAIDSVESLVDRIRFPVLKQMDKLQSVDLSDNASSISSTDTSSNNKAGSESNPPAPKEDKGKVESEQDAPSHNISISKGKTSFDKMQKEDFLQASSEFGQKCAAAFQKVGECSTEDECHKSSVALTYCMAPLVCQPEAEKYKKDLTNDKAYDEMINCMGRFEQAALKIVSKDAH